MPNARLKSYLHLHFIVFIWGFTAILGKLITIEALPLVWYRMLIALIIIAVFMVVKKYKIKVPPKTLLMLLIAGVVLALHWITFFRSIKVSNVSIALAAVSSGPFFTALLEPLWYTRKIIWYEIVFGFLVVLGLYIIFNVEAQYLEGIVLGAVSALLASIFSLINGKLIKSERPSLISFYEMGTGVLLITLYLGFLNGFTPGFFQLSYNDWFFLFLLGSICTAYAFIVSVKVMRYISPYTVMLTTSLEPIYGIVLALLLFGDTERMNALFYLGALIILATVLANGVLKNRRRIKK
ncbi:DMT family transporter [Spongiimicrobium sp. 3-5]|uniref:DMT family transporter n=1 Tax=Spongiimicrobium sp. 3-5 TaxID=3332596 RepID=UPI003980B1EC